MKIETFFSHWNLRENPFTAEEARDDDVYARIMSDGVAHPEFEKIFGRPERPSTSVVFGEKGSGKTALRLLMEQRLKEYNENNPRKKTWIVRYDEWNHMVDRTVGAENADDPEAFKRIRLEDHIDKMISMVVTEIIDAASRPTSSKVSKELCKSLRRMPRQHRLDLAYLTILYDQPSLSTRGERWRKISKVLRVGSLITPSKLLYLFGAGAMITFLSALDLTTFGGLLGYYSMGAAAFGGLLTFIGGWFGISSAWANHKRRKTIQEELKVVDHPGSALFNQLGSIKAAELDSLPMPTPGDQDCRYELLGRLQRILKNLDFVSITVLVDRVDEPSLVNGNGKKMRNLIWPLFSHKILQQDGLGIKMLLPIELGYELKREDGEFFSKARLDKSNLIERLEWTGVNLYDICNHRVKAVYEGESEPTLLKDLFEERVSVQDLVDALDQMKQPRDAFKFLYEVIIQHCKGSTDAEPEFLIPKLTLEQARRKQAQRVQDLARGFSAA